jgi:hypothetical protein
MKIVKVFSATATLFVMLLFASCEKEAISPVDTTAFPEVKERNTDCNPHDQIGSLHNEGLSYILADEDYLADPDNSQDEKKAFLVDKNEAFLSAVEVNGETYSGDEGYDWYSIFETNLEDADSAIDANPALNDNEKDFLKQYFAALEDMDASTADGLNSLVAFSESMECAVNGNPEFENQEIMLSAISVAKHSAQYWSGFSSGSSGVTLQRWLLADAMGAMYGSSAGPLGMLGFGVLGSALSYAYDKGYID